MPKGGRDTVKTFLVKVWACAQWVWGKVKTTVAFIVDFVKWIKERRKAE